MRSATLQPPLVLASSSPRRRELLAGLGLAFSIDPPGIDEAEPESFADRQHVIDWVRQLAIDKAAAVAVRYPPDTWVLGADTTVVLGHEVYGKPTDERHAVEMLLRLQGQTHTVMTAISLQTGRDGASNGTIWSDVVETDVSFYACGRAELEAYVATGESMDKAGAYAAQGMGALIIARIDGCYFNVVGLPLAAVSRRLRSAGFDVWSAATGAKS